MLNEMNPKLKALLAAGLIGTASLGMQSCAQPTDDYDTEWVEPTNGDETNTATDDNGNEGEENTAVEETEEQKWTNTFGQLLTYSEENKDHAERLATSYTPTNEIGVSIDEDALENYKYTGTGFEKITENIQSTDTYYKYTSSDFNYVYHVHEDKKADFDRAIAAYRAIHAN